MGICERIKDEVSITDYARYMGFTILKRKLLHNEGT